MKQTAHIENWTECPVFPTGSVLVGTVTRHARQTEFETNLQQTSRLVSLDRIKGIAETNNTIYSLGKEIPENERR